MTDPDTSTTTQKPERVSQPSCVLDGHDLKAVAKYMKSEQCKNVFLMIGAGVSTSAGIPDFRSKDTGLYTKLAKLNLPYPEAVFEISFFRNNPKPFYALAKELYPGRFRPTLAHSFIRLLHEKSLLHTCFTQNIDTLERLAGVPETKIIEAHGTFATQRCIECKVPYDREEMRTKIMAQKVPHCKQCDGLVKPDIVFFGEGLPPKFFSSLTNLLDADLLIIMGTSLVVYPFASLPGYVPSECPRVLINKEPVHSIGNKSNDVICLSKCDDAVRDLCAELGWLDELQKLWDATASVVEPQPGKLPEQPAAAASVQEEADELAALIEKKLVMTDVTHKIALAQSDSASKQPSESQTKKVVGEMAERIAHKQTELALEEASEAVDAATTTPSPRPTLDTDSAGREGLPVPASPAPEPEVKL